MATAAGGRGGIISVFTAITIVAIVAILFTAIALSQKPVVFPRIPRHRPILPFPFLAVASIVDGIAPSTARGDSLP